MLEYNDLITSIPEDILSSDWHHRIQNVHFKDLDDIFSFYYKYILKKQIYIIHYFNTNQK